MASMHGRFATKDVICAGLTARPLSIEPLESWIDQRDIAIQLVQIGSCIADQ
jgi:hypothetical protein